MNSSQLHSWVLRHLTTLQHASTDRQGELIGGAAPEHEFWMEAGRHKGLNEASGLLLDLIAEMQAEERAVVAEGLADLGLCDLCGSEEGQRTKELRGGVTAWVCGRCRSKTDTPDLDTSGFEPGCWSNLRKGGS